MDSTELNFRFFHKEQNKMIYFNLFDNDDDYIFGQEETTYHTDEDIMQNSGQIDKKSENIYSGDIVKRQNRYIGIVIFEKGCFKIKWKDGVYYGWARHIDDYQESSLEIIGNIYENLELLEDKNNGQ